MKIRGESVDVDAMWLGGGGSGSLINLIGLCNIMMTYQSSCPPSIQQMGHPGLHTQNIYFVFRSSDSSNFCQIIFMILKRKFPIDVNASKHMLSPTEDR